MNSGSQATTGPSAEPDAILSAPKARLAQTATAMIIDFADFTIVYFIRMISFCFLIKQLCEKRDGKPMISGEKKRP